MSKTDSSDKNPDQTIEESKQDRQVIRIREHIAQELNQVGDTYDCHDTDNDREVRVEVIE